MCFYCVSLLKKAIRHPNDKFACLLLDLLLRHKLYSCTEFSKSITVLIKQYKHLLVCSRRRNSQIYLLGHLLGKHILCDDHAFLFVEFSLFPMLRSMDFPADSFPLLSSILYKKGYLVPRETLRFLCRDEPWASFRKHILDTDRIVDKFGRPCVRDAIIPGQWYAPLLTP